MVRTVVFFAVASVGAALAQAPPAGETKAAVENQLLGDARNVPPQPAEAKKDVSTEMRGDILVARKMYREAIDTYKEAPQSAVILNKIGIAYHQLMDLDAARKYYEKSLKMNPQYAEAINNLGTIHYAKKNFRRAVSQYKKALKYSPDSASIYSNLGTAYFARKDYGQVPLLPGQAVCQERHGRACADLPSESAGGRAEGGPGKNPRDAGVRQVPGIAGV